MRKYTINNSNQNNSGYALYTAIILTSLLVVVAYATANLSLKELALSTTASDSHLAFYNADSGLECALYWDIKNPNAVPTPGSISAFDVSTAGSITCNGQTITTNSQTVQTSPNQSSVIGGASVSIFQLNLTSGCSIVKVTKSGVSTIIESRGYNSCSGSHRLERGVIIQY